MTPLPHRTAPTRRLFALFAAALFLATGASAPAQQQGQFTTGRVIPAPTVPRDANGESAKVFMVLTPQATEAYVGEMVPVRIDFYIAQEANADQDSLPTLKGSDFMMNDFVVRGHASLIVLEGKPYECDTFLTAFSAPRSGDFPLASERDTYWVKSVSASGLDPFGFTRNTHLGHGMITSNAFTMHILPLPDAGKPQHFSGAVGQFTVASDAQPAGIKFGEPATLTFGISGVGNFDYVKCPVLAPDPNWKVYAPTATTTLTDEERTQGSKTFEQRVLPQENGNVPLPRAAFSYFNPHLKQYVTVPIELPTIAVTGAMPLRDDSSSAASISAATSVTIAATNDELAPNRTEVGDLQPSMQPLYRAFWFWPGQAILAALPLLALLVLLVRRCFGAGRESTSSVLRQRALRQKESEMEEAARQGNTTAFFLAARQAIQLQLAAQWPVAPESLTLGEIRRRDPARAEALAPLFAQADEVLYSGGAGANLDLTHWQRVARECLHLQPTLP